LAKAGSVVDSEHLGLEARTRDPTTSLSLGNCSDERGGRVERGENWYRGENLRNSPLSAAMLRVAYRPISSGSNLLKEGNKKETYLGNPSFEMEEESSLRKIIS